MLPDRLTILYTACLRGRLADLPRLYTLIKHTRAALDGPSILLDLGESCTPDEWLCQATAGRALLVAMDSMGYDAFYIDHADPLASDALTFSKLQAVIVTPLVTASHPLSLAKHTSDAERWTLQLIGESNPSPADLPNQQTLTVHLRRAPSGAGGIYYDSTRRMVYLTDQWDSLQVGRLELALGEGQITAHTYFALTPDLPSDPTISGVVEFVAAEARYASQRGKK